MIRKIAERTFLSFLVIAGTSTSVWAKKVNLEWKPIPGAISYELQFQKDEGSLIQKKMKEPKWSGEIPFGIYTYQIRGMDAVNRPGQWSAVRPLVVLPPAPQPESPSDGQKIKLYSKEIPVLLKWDPLEGVKEYLVTVKKEDKKISEQRVKGESLEVKGLSSGKYTWQVAGILSPGGRAPASIQSKKWKTASQSLDFKLDQGKLEKPIQVSPKGILPPPDSHRIKLKWKEVDGAEAYEVEIAQVQQSHLQRMVKKMVTTEHSIEVRVPVEGKYRWKVRALANIDEKKNPQAVGEESQMQFSLDRNAIFKGDYGYVALSSMLAPYKYTISDPPSNMRGSMNGSALIFRGSGEYYLHPQWGLSGAVEFGTFTVLGRSVTRPGAELMLKYRVNLTSGSMGWFLSPKAGLELRDYNQVLVTRTSGSSTQNVTVADVFTVGSSIGFDLRKQFTDKFSLGVKAGSFIPLKLVGSFGAGGTLSGNSLSKNINFGAQGLYWVRPKIGLGVGGFFESRAIGFTSSDSNGALREISTNATYFFGSIVIRLSR